MWNDEDNNPYSSFDRSPTSQHIGSSPYERSGAPDSDTDSPQDEPPDFITQPTAGAAGQDDSRSEGDDEDEEAYRSGHRVRPKKGGYDSRIEQILYERPDLDIVITEAGKSQENGGNFIVYTIRTGDLEVRRRYSEFSSLRQTLVNLHPTLVVPPIPEKHSMADYAAKPTKAKEDLGIIDLRKRMLTVFLNRCRKMKEIREDGVWWRFLDPNASWNEVLHSAPVASIPKSNMKAPPLNPSNPTPAHQWLPVPSTSAKLRSSSVSSPSGTPTSPPPHAASASTAAHSVPGPQVFGRFPPSAQHLSEAELDPYFTAFEAATRELEALLTGAVSRCNQRTLAHLGALGADLAELGARYNGFALSEAAPTLAAALERVGQAADASYLAAEELAGTLGAAFAEPMRESAQFAGVVRQVLRYRVLRRVQQEMTRDELARKRALLAGLERSESEAQRIEQYIASTGPGGPGGGTGGGSGVRRSASSAAPASARRGDGAEGARGSPTPEGDTASIDSDFPPTHSDLPSSGVGARSSSGDAGTPQRSKSVSGAGNFVTNRIFGRISHAMHGIVDVDPERTRRDQIGKTKESLSHLEQALEVSEKDVKDASAGVLKDLKRFQGQKEEDLRRYMLAYARCHIDWARKNLETWREAADEVAKIDAR